MDRPATLSGAREHKVRSPIQAPTHGYICPSVDSGRKLSGKTSIYYNGCYTTATGATRKLRIEHRLARAREPARARSATFWRGDGTAATAAAAPAHSTWTGCVNDRDQDYDTKNDAPGSSNASPSSKFYAEQWKDCLTATVTFR